MQNQSSAENNNGELVDHHGGRFSDEFQETVEIVTFQEFSQLLESESRKCHSGSWRRRQIQKVPPQVRLRRQQSEHVYDPVMVSLGPYHHGKQGLRRAEEFKYVCLDWCAMGNEKKKAFFYNRIIEKIEVIRECYAEVTIVEKYDDKALSLMMLLDACFIINFMHNCLDMNRNNYLDWQNCLGAGSGPFMVRDMMVLENQIPFPILKLLISLQYEKEEVEEFLQRFLSHMMSMGLNQAKIPRENEEPPIHLLEACWRVMAKKHISEPNQRVHNYRLASKFRWPRFSMRGVHNQPASKFQWPTRFLMGEEIIKNDVNKFRWSRFSMREEKNDETNISYAHRSVMDLKAKGIYIRPNSSPSFMDITFTSHAFYGQLQLPVRPVSDLTRVIYSNMIAYEVSPNSGISDLVMLSYVILMKSLIQSPEDVKELQEKGILLNRFANLEKVVKSFKEIDTFGLHDQDIFIDVKQRVEEHFNNKAKTWIADLIHTRFQTPWTAIAFFAAVLFLCLTFLQTFFTIQPVKMK